MSWDQRLFGRLYGWLAARGAQARRTRAVGVALAPVRDRLALIASAIAARRLGVLLADGDGGVRGLHLVMPPVLAVLDDTAANARLARVRAVVGAVMVRDGRALPPDDEARALATVTALVRARAAIAAELPGAATELAALVPALLAARAWPTRPADRVAEAAVRLALGAPLAEVAAAVPGAPAAWLAAIAAGDADDPVPLAGGRVPAPALCGWLGDATLDGVPLPPPGAEPRAAGGSERQGRARDRVRRRQLPGSPETENPLVHSFEKVHTLDRYLGGRKRIDGADELDAHGDALDELGLDEVVRSSAPTSSVYRAEVLGVDDGGEVDGAPEAEASALCYDEWDEGRRAYRRAWCQVRVEREPGRASPEVAARFVAAARARFRRERNQLAAQLARLDAQPRWRGRQPDGPDIDIDAIVDRHGALRRGVTGPDRLYLDQRRRPPELAVALLLDRSLSADAWVADQRVLDVGRAALVALGDALDHVAARTAIFAFASHTRRDCRVALVKGFDAPWAQSHARLAAIEPAGYTRIGPALRHVTAELDREPARRKLLVLLSDGKPTDYDRYEGRYGLADVRCAVAEAGRAGVHVFAVALDRRAGHHLPAMFGRGGFAVVTRPRDLVAAVGQLYRQRLVR